MRDFFFSSSIIIHNYDTANKLLFHSWTRRAYFCYVNEHTLCFRKKIFITQFFIRKVKKKCSIFIKCELFWEVGMFCKGVVESVFCGFVKLILELRNFFVGLEFFWEFYAAGVCAGKSINLWLKWLEIWDFCCFEDFFEILDNLINLKLQLFCTSF